MLGRGSEGSSGVFLVTSSEVARVVASVAGLLEVLLGPLGLPPAGSESVDQEGVDSGEVLGVAPVEGGSCSRRKVSVPLSKTFKAARREGLSIAQLAGQLRGSADWDRSLARRSLADESAEIPRLT